MDHAEEMLLKEFRELVEEEVKSIEAGLKEHAQSFGREAPNLKARAADTLVISLRHFATGRSLDFRREMLKIAAEATGIALEPLPQPDGPEVLAWRPARGEVGWTPYNNAAELWAQKEVATLLQRYHPTQRHAVLSALIGNPAFAYPQRAGETIVEVATGLGRVVSEWWPFHPDTKASGEHVMVETDRKETATGAVVTYSPILPVVGNFVWPVKEASAATVPVEAVAP